MDFPDWPELTWCTEHEIAFPKGRECPVDEARSRVGRLEKIVEESALALIREQERREEAQASARKFVGLVKECQEFMQALSDLTTRWKFDEDTDVFETLEERLKRADAAEKRVTELEQLVCDFQAAALLGDDSDGITPAHVERHITRLRAALEQVEFLAVEDGGLICLWCNGDADHEDNCPRQVALEGSG